MLLSCILSFFFFVGWVLTLMNNGLIFPYILQDVMLLLVQYVSSSLVAIVWILEMHYLYLFIFFLSIVWSLGFWEHRFVWQKYFLVLGNFSCSIFLCNMGTVSCLLILVHYLWILFITLFLTFSIMNLKSSLFSLFNHGWYYEICLHFMTLFLGICHFYVK